MSSAAVIIGALRGKSSLMQKGRQMLQINMIYHATGFILQHRFFAKFTCLSSLLRHFKPLKNIKLGRRHKFLYVLLQKIFSLGFQITTQTEKNLMGILKIPWEKKFP